ncbi:MAG: cation:proton antiporter [Thermoanaerobaculia bacterium]|nr:cation:proton antiporter [Thermoanaerobaculia bacterium]
METLTLVVIGGAILGFGLVSRKIERSFLSAPIVFVSVGWAASELGVLHFELGGEAIHLLAELTLVLVLFTDAARIDVGLLRREHNLPLRMLGIGLPLTVLLGTLGAAWIFPSFTYWQAALLAAVLAPTDAALGQAVVSSPKVPVRMRQTLNVESGLNDGIALPLVLLFLSACSAHVEGAGGAEYWLRFAALQLTLGPLVGVVVGWLGGEAVRWCRARGWISTPFLRLSTLGLALVAFAGAEIVHGNGFIAAFVGGLTLGNRCTGLWHSLEEFAEAEGQFFTLMVFLVFGATTVPEYLPYVDFAAVVYGLLSLTLIRMVPVSLSLLGTGLRPASHLFLGWFGPRGIASILFGLLVVESSILEPRSEIFAVITVTVLMSVVAHGATAWSGALWYAKHAESFDLDEAEAVDVEEMPVRLSRPPTSD